MGFLTKSFFRGLAAIVPVVVTVYMMWWFFTGADMLLKKLLAPDGTNVSRVVDGAQLVWSDGSKHPLPKGTKLILPRTKKDKPPKGSEIELPDGTRESLPEGAEFLLPTESTESVIFFPGLGVAAGVVLAVLVGIMLNFWLIRGVHSIGTSILERLPIVKTIFRMLSDMAGLFSNSDEKDYNQVVMVQPMPGGPEMIGFVTRKTWEGMPEGFGGDGKIAVYLPMSYQIGGFLVVVHTDDVTPIDMEMEEALRIVLAAGISKAPEKAAT